MQHGILHTKDEGTIAQPLEYMVRVCIAIEMRLMPPTYMGREKPLGGLKLRSGLSKNTTTKKHFKHWEVFNYDETKHESLEI